MINLYSAYCGYSHGNSGDLVSKILIERLFNTEVSLVTTEEPEGDYNLVMGGSIAGNIKPSFSGHIFGTGAIFENDRINLPLAKINALRGKLTLHRWVSAPYLKQEIPLGDPGLLVDRLFDAKLIPKKFVVGIIPHYVHNRELEIRTWIRRNENDVLCIDICSRLDHVLEQIAQCEFVISSSLHGLIFSDALNVPNKWIYIDDQLAGNSFKFRDYYSAFGITDPMPILFNADLKIKELLFHHPIRVGIEKIKEDLFNAFPMELLQENAVDVIENVPAREQID